MLTMNKNYNKPLTVLVEGNIACGKTNLLNTLEKSEVFKVFHEPLAKWQNLNGMNLFDLYYRDPKKYFVPFQLYVLQTLHEQQNTFCERPVRLMERSSLSAQNVFNQAALIQKIIDQPTNLVLETYFNLFQEKFPIEPDLIIYVRSTPEEIYKRIHHRGRFEERQISLNYIRLLHNLYEKWINAVDCPVIFVDGDLPLMEMDVEYRKCKDVIMQMTFDQVANSEERIV